MELLHQRNNKTSAYLARPRHASAVRGGLCVGTLASFPGAGSVHRFQRIVVVVQCGKIVLGDLRWPRSFGAMWQYCLRSRPRSFVAVWQYCPRFLPLPFWCSVAASTVPGLGRGPSGAALVAKFVCGREFVMLCVWCTWAGDNFIALARWARNGSECIRILSPCWHGLSGTSVGVPRTQKSSSYFRRKRYELNVSFCAYGRSVLRLLQLYFKIILIFWL